MKEVDSRRVVIEAWQAREEGDRSNSWLGTRDLSSEPIGQVLGSRRDDKWWMGDETGSVE